MILDRISQDLSGFRHKVILGLFIFLIVIPSFFGGEWSKWLQAAILVSTSLLAFYLIILLGQQPAEPETPKASMFTSSVFYLVIFLLAVAASSVVSVNHYDSVSLLFLLLSYAVVFVGAMYFFTEWKRVWTVSRVIFFVGVIAALISLIMFAFQSDNRGSGFLFNANALGSYLLFSLPLGIMISTKQQQKRTRFIYYLGTAIIAVALALTYSYTSWVSFISPAIMLVIFFRKTIFTKRVMLAGAGLVVCAVILLTVFRYTKSHNWSSAAKIYNTINQEHLVTSFTQRLNFSYSAIRMLADRPLTGYGFNTFQAVYARYALSLLEQPRYAHNYYLQTAAETGVVGGLAFTIFVILLIIKTYRKISVQTDREKKLIYLGIWLGLLGSAIHALFDFGWQFPAVFILFWLSAGILSAKESVTDHLDGDTPAAAGNKSILSVKILFALVAIAFLIRGFTLFLAVNYFQKADREFVDGNFETGYGYYAHGGRFDPDPSRLTNEASGLGIGYQVLKPDQQDTLKKDFIAALRQNPEFYAGHYYLGQLYFADKNEAAALPEYEKAIEYNPTFRPDYYYAAALVYYDQKDYENSKKTVLNILNRYGSLESSSNPNLPIQLAFLHILLGQNYQTAGQFDKARGEYKHALRLKPNLPLAEQKLKELP